MKQKALFFDIDGTLMSDITHTIPESTVKALNQARQNGHKIFINTGRVVCSLPPELAEIEFDGILCGCGTYIAYQGQVLHKSSFSKERCKELIALIKKYRLGAVLESRKDVYFPKESSRFQTVNRIRERFYSLSVGVNDGFETENIVFDKLVIEADDDSNKEQFFKAVEKDMDIIDRGGNVYECVQKNHSKATAIDFILDTLGMELTDAFVFGDSSNDLAMFVRVPNAVAMGKYSEVLEPYTSFVTKPVEQDGIWYAMEHFGII